MKRKGEMQAGVMIMTFLSIIVGLILLTSTYDFVGQTTNTFTLANYTFTFPSNGNTVDLYGQELINTPGFINRSNGVVIPSTNYTVSEGISSVDGLKRIRLTGKSGPFAGVVVNASYDYGHVGYIDDSGGRAVTSLIPIFGAIAVIVAGLVGLAFKKGWIDF